MEIKNVEKMTQFIGLRRSGNHGVIDWILAHCHSWTHYNNIIYSSEATTANQWTIQNFGSFKLASFEDYPLDFLPLKGRKILLLRDPFNTFASRLQHLRNSLDKTKFYDNWSDFSDFYVNLNMVSPGAFNLWKQYANAYLNDKYKAIKINFNKWFEDIDYRKFISKKLGFRHTDEGFNSSNGNKFSGGSSFNKFDPLNSWQNMCNEEEYLSYFDDEIIELSRSIFGEIPNLSFKFQRNDYIDKVIEICLNYCNHQDKCIESDKIITQAMNLFNNTRLLQIRKLVDHLLSKK